MEVCTLLYYFRNVLLRLELLRTVIDTGVDRSLVETLLVTKPLRADLNYENSLTRSLSIWLAKERPWQAKDIIRNDSTKTK